MKFIHPLKSWKNIDVGSLAMVIIGLITIFIGGKNWWVGILISAIGITKQSIYPE